jgi:hypothetical protein
MSEYIRRKLDNLPNILKVVEADEIRVPNAKQAAKQTVAYFKQVGRKVVVHKETNNRYLVMPEHLDPLTFVTDRSVTWDNVEAVQVLARTISNFTNHG